jgi:hypothetical protein
LRKWLGVARWRINRAAFTSHSGGVALAEKVPGNNQSAAKIAPIRRRRKTIKRVYLFRDFLHKSTDFVVV